LPPGFYALAEQHLGQVIPDVLTLSSGPLSDSNGSPGTSLGGGTATGAVALADAPPKVALRMTASEEEYYRVTRRTLAIRHRSGHRVIAMIEIASPGNKDGKRPLEQFVSKAVAALQNGIHLLVIDLFPPGPFDPAGIHAAIWREVGGGEYEPPDDRPLTLAAYLAAVLPDAFVEPTAVGRELVDMPVFLDFGSYINVPLEPTYEQAWRGVPDVWRKAVEGRGA
jgi:hypothetical protein